MTGSCPQCSATTFETQRFCRYCGYRLTQDLNYNERRTSHLLSVTALATSVNDPSESPTVPMQAGRETTRLRQPRRRFSALIGLLTAASVAGFAAGFVFEKVSPVWISEKLQPAPAPTAIPSQPVIAIRPLPPTPPAPPAPPAMELERAPRVESRRAPRPPHRQDNHLLLGHMLSSRVAVTERKIAELRKHLSSLKASEHSESRRQAMLEKISALEQERLALSVAAEALNRNTLVLDQVLQNIIPSQAVLQKIVNDHIGKTSSDPKVKPMSKSCETKPGTVEERIGQTLEPVLDEHPQQP